MPTRHIAMVWKGKADGEALRRLLQGLQSQFGRGGAFPVDLVRSPAGGSLELELETPGEGLELLRQIGRAAQRAGGQMLEKGSLDAALNTPLLLPTQGVVERFDDPMVAAEQLEQHLASLGTAASIDQRRTRRIDVRLRTELWANSRYAEGLATNMSLGGMFVKTELRPTFRSQIGLRAALPGGETLVATATVVHILELTKDGGLGLEFVYDPELQEKVSKFLATVVG